MEHTTNETLRKTLHIAFGLFAFTLKWLPWWAAALVAAAAVLGNWMLLHRVVGRSVARDARGFDAGIVAYPLAVLLLILVFRERLHYAAIAWVLLAFGDGVATLAGRSLRLGSLPWNRDKSWGGLVAFLLFGGAAAFAAGAWLGYWETAVILVATVVAAIVESLPLGIDDNLSVPFAAAVALVLAGIDVIYPFAVWPFTPHWLLVNAAFALVGFFTRSVTFSGALGGWLLGAVLILGGGWPLFVTLLTFFVIGTLATRFGYARKAAAGLAQETGGRRGFSHAFANVGVAALCAIAVSRLARSEHGVEELELVAMFMAIAALATAAADTTASEIGQLLGKRAFLPLTLRRVPVGTEGAISIEGTLAGALAGLAVSVAGCGSVDRMFMGVTFSVPIVLAIAVAALAGSYIESIAGSWNRRQTRPVPNGVLNFFNTATGALLFLAIEQGFDLFSWSGLVESSVR